MLVTQATNPSDLITMMQNKGIDLGQLRNVLNSGDLRALIRPDQRAGAAIIEKD